MTMPPGIHPPAASDDWNAIRSWRKGVREELIRRRTEIAPRVRRRMAEEACARIVEAVDWRSIEVLAFCWPIKGEFDVRSIAERHAARGGEVALPVAVAPSAPLEFWRWRPGMPMRTGVWNIPIPAERHVLIPDAVIAPLVGFDARGYRLGYGGGYFDRTLAAASPQPQAIGLGYSNAELETIYPQPHDIPMNLIVTEQGVLIPK
ncbi:MAG: 5-formyltetrahydrofolate cyclo-ligase [Steroidobacteraceae bacterium]|jgi:5-formyltetrahydrofolate cyclo-ligase